MEVAASYLLRVAPEEWDVHADTGSIVWLDPSNTNNGLATCVYSLPRHGYNRAGPGFKFVKQKPDGPHALPLVRRPRCPR